LIDIFYVASLTIKVGEGDLAVARAAIFA
jgi:hypothetical protein